MDFQDSSFSVLDNAGNLNGMMNSSNNNNSFSLEVTKSLVNAETLFWCNWREVVQKADAEIDNDLLKLQSFHPCFAFIKEHLKSEFELPFSVSVEILHFLPVRSDRKTEFIACFDIPADITQKQWTCINNRARDNIEKFANLTGSSDMKRRLETVDISFQILEDCIAELYWFRFGIERVSEQHPYSPSDVLGILKNGQWFYYKDGHPHWMAGETPHRQWMCILGHSLKHLLLQMDKRDVNDFIHNEKNWKPLPMDRCGCARCIEDNHSPLYGCEVDSLLIPNQKQKDTCCCHIL